MQRLIKIGYKLLVVNVCILLIVIYGLSLTVYAQQPTAKPLTNADVIKLLENGFGDEQVISTIQASPVQFDISADVLIELKKTGVSQQVIAAMLKAATPKTTSVAPELELSTTTNPITNTVQPYILVASKTNKSVLSADIPTIVQTKAKGDNMASILADSAVQDIASTAITSVAASAIMAAPGVAAIPIVGAAGAVMLKMPGIRRDPTFTYVYALAGRQSHTSIDTETPRFELFFGRSQP